MVHPVRAMMRTDFRLMMEVLNKFDETLKGNYFRGMLKI